MVDGPGEPVCEVLDGAVLVRVLVQPGASRQRVVGRHGDAVKVAVSAPPERGRANESVRRLLARALDVPLADVEVVAGAAARRKRIRVVAGDPVAVAARVRALVDG